MFLASGCCPVSAIDSPLVVELLLELAPLPQALRQGGLQHALDTRGLGHLPGDVSEGPLGDGLAGGVLLGALLCRSYVLVRVDRVLLIWLKNHRIIYLSV